MHPLRGCNIGASIEGGIILVHPLRGCNVGASIEGVYIGFILVHPLRGCNIGASTEVGVILEPVSRLVILF